MYLSLSIIDDNDGISDDDDNCNGDDSDNL